VPVADVSIRDLRNKGGEVVERASRGEPIRITRAGKPVAELRPLPRPGLTADALLARWRRLPPLDPVALRGDIDELIDSSL
jgi:prevent-host-death family protein